MNTLSLSPLVWAVLLAGMAIYFPSLVYLGLKGGKKAFYFTMVGAIFMAGAMGGVLATWLITLLRR